MADGIDAALSTLVLQSPPAQQSLVASVRAVCANTLSVPPLPAEGVVAEHDSAVADFAEQFSVDVSAISDEQRAALISTLGPGAFGAVVQMFVADFLPRVRVGLEALGLPVVWVPEHPVWDHGVDAAAVVFDDLLPAVARLRELDPVTSEVVRLRGAAAHNCRLCKSLREGNALDAGGSETLYADIERYDESDRLTDAQKAALRYVDALTWSPARIAPEVVEEVRRHFSAEQSRELTLDVMRNASNKIAVALKADAPRVEHGTERYVIDADGQTQFA